MADHDKISLSAPWKRNTVSLTAMAASLIFSTTAFAQVSSDAAQGAYPGEIVVTANKREQNLGDVGLSVTAFGSDALVNQRISTGQDLAAGTPGLAYAPSPTNTPVYTLRGVGFYEGSLAAYPDVSLYIDQVPLSLPVMATKTIFDLERVEVLKGPQGTLFGNNATGGAINFVAAKPTRELSAGIELGYGRFNTFEAAGFISGPLADTLRARIAFRAENGDGWQRSQTRNDSLGKKDNVAGRFILDWEPSDKLALSLNINGWQDQDEPQATQVFRRDIKNPPGSVGFGGIVPDDLPVLFTPIVQKGAIRAADWSSNYRPYTNNKFWQTTLRADYELTDGITLTSLTGYSDLQFLNSTDEDGSSLVIFSYTDNQGDVNSFTQELRIANDSSAPFRWVLGANYERTKAFQNADQPSYDSSSAAVNGFGLVAVDALQRMRNYAGFANVEYDINERLTLKGGIRQSKAKRRSSNATFTRPGLGPLGGRPYTTTEFFNLVYGAIYGEGVVPFIEEGQSFSLDQDTLVARRYFGKLSESSTSWSAGIDFKPVDGLLIYGNISKGYKSGSFPFVTAAVIAAYAPVTQESLLSYEVGLKAELLDRKLSLSAAGFYYDYKDKQLRTKFIDPIFGALDKLENVPKSRVTGAEFDVTARVVDGLTISASATYLDAVVRDYVGVVGQNLLPSGLREAVFASFRGERLPFTPKLSYALRFDYESSINNTLNVFFGAGVSGQSKIYSSLAATPEAKSDYTIKGYALVNANIGIKSNDDRWRFSIWGKNIFNKFYLSNRFESYDTYVQTTGRPTEYGATISFRY